MRRSELDFILSKMLESQQEVSDLNFTVDKPLQVESFGELVPVPLDPPLERLTPFQTEMIALNLIGGNRRLTEDLLRTGSCDASYTLSNKARFRVNVFSQRANYSIVLRKLNTQIPTMEDLCMPDIFQEVSKEKTGLILVTGATGSGKTTTLAALLNEINEDKSIHIITLEDPVEYVHPQKKATFNQRELGIDFNSFASGLRAALRQAPKVILVGEMRDRETVEIGMTAAETGHLVLATLHTIDASKTIERIIDRHSSPPHAACAAFTKPRKLGARDPRRRTIDRVRVDATYPEQDGTRPGSGGARWMCSCFRAGMTSASISTSTNGPRRAASGSRSARRRPHPGRPSAPPPDRARPRVAAGPPPSRTWCGRSPPRAARRTELRPGRR